MVVIKTNIVGKLALFNSLLVLIYKNPRLKACACPIGGALLQVEGEGTNDYLFRSLDPRRGNRERRRADDAAGIRG
jgi:hypothetical protein